MREAVPLIEVQKLSKEYKMGEVTVKALAGVDLVINKGEFIVILGPSGSGKSTLMNIIGGMDVPTSGSVKFKGKDIAAFHEKELTVYRRDQIGFIFQFYNLIPSLTALENISIAAQLVTRPLSSLEQLELVGLEGRASSFPSQLSGGEQQRVAIARAIVKDPELLLCDEPTGALDSTTGKKVLQVLLDINQKQGKTVVIITHNGDIGKIAGRIIKMADGKISEDITNHRREEIERIGW
ncbi:MAG: ABC transporter ATP-binding protein [Peptococcaceae bacterium]